METLGYGHRYGNVTVSDTAQVQLGDRFYMSGDHSAKAEFETWKRGFLGVLNYDHIQQKSQQLDALNAPMASFQWLENTMIPNWLEADGDFFWISGKPGSGKSVLMKHLASSHSTSRRLQSWKTNCLILNFFFDFRAGTTEANDMTGMLKLFLRQLSEQSEAANEHFRRLVIAVEELRGADVSKLTEILSSTLSSCDLPLCTFIDGLDEYEGGWVDLIEFLQRLQDRTGIKICLASRPEPQLKQLLHRYPMILMQDYNEVAVRTYIERELIKSRGYDLNIDLKISDDLKDEIVLKAQGIILWARLAVDELLRGYEVGLSASEVQQILTTLPPELGKMYDRILSKLNMDSTNESAMLIHTLMNWDYGAGIKLGPLLGLWDLFLENFAGSSPAMNNDLDTVRFAHRLDYLLRTLIDLHPNQPVRLLHRTFHDHMLSSRWLSDNVPANYMDTFPDHPSIRMGAYAVIRATEGHVISKSKIYEHIDKGQITTQQDLALLIAQWRTSTCDPRWSRRMQIISESICWFPQNWGFLQDAITYAVTPLPMVNAKRLYESVQSALQSPLMLLALYEADNHWMLRAATKSIPQDVFLAIHHGLKEYAQWRVSAMSSTDKGTMQAVFDFAIDHMLNSGVCVDTAEIIANNLLAVGAEVAQYHACLFMQSRPWQTLTMGSDIERAHRILAAPRHGLNTTRHCESCPERALNSTLLFEWVKHCKEAVSWEAAPGPKVLELIIAVGEDINLPCYERGTALHALVDPELYDGTNWKELLDIQVTMATLIDAGANTSVQHAGRTPYDYAEALKRQFPLSHQGKQSRWKRVFKRSSGTPPTQSERGSPQLAMPPMNAELQRRYEKVFAEIFKILKAG